MTTLSEKTPAGGKKKACREDQEITWRGGRHARARGTFSSLFPPSSPLKFKQQRTDPTQRETYRIRRGGETYGERFTLVEESRWIRLTCSRNNQLLEMYDHQERKKKVFFFKGERGRRVSENTDHSFLSSSLLPGSDLLGG